MADLVELVVWAAFGLFVVYVGYQTLYERFVKMDVTSR